MPPEVRSATVMDATAICNVLRRSITECCVADHRGDPGMISAWLENKTPEDVVAWIQSPSAVAVVATRPNSLVGFALSSDEEFALCHVIHEALHQGIGELLLAAIESRSVAHGIAMLRLESTRTASQFYLRNGSVPSGPVQLLAGTEGQPMVKQLMAIPSVKGTSRYRDVPYVEGWLCTSGRSHSTRFTLSQHLYRGSWT